MRFAILAVLPLLVGCSSPFDSPLVQACESAAKLRLRSPSTYQRIEVADYSSSPDEMTVEEYVAWEARYHPAYANAATDGMAIGPKLFKVFIHYDADNAYGTPVRGIAACEWAEAFGTLDRAPSNMLLVVNGQTFGNWAADE